MTDNARINYQNANKGHDIFGGWANTSDKQINRAGPKQAEKNETKNLLKEGIENTIRSQTPINDSKKNPRQNQSETQSKSQIDFGFEHKFNIPDHLKDGQLGKASLNEHTTERYSKNVAVRKTDSNISNIFSTQDQSRATDQTMKDQSKSKSELASKKTNSSIVFGMDKQDTVNSFHLNHHDKMKEEKHREAEGFTPRWIEKQKDSIAIKNNFIYGTDQVDREALKNKPISSKVNVMGNFDVNNKLTNEDPNHRKQEFLKSNIFNDETSHTNVKDKLQTNKTKVKDEQVLDFNDKNTLKNKRNELNSHFCIGDNTKFEEYKNIPMTYEKNSWKDNNQADKVDHMQSNIFHLETSQKRDFNKVKEEKNKESTFLKNQSKFNVEEVGDTKTLKQKNLISHFDMDNEHKSNLDHIKNETVKSQGWRDNAQTSQNKDLQTTGDTLKGENQNESKIRTQQNLRSCMESADSFSSQMQSRKVEKKVVEIELDFGKGVSEDTIFDNFKGMHIVSKEISYNNITGEAQGKGKVKVRLDDAQEKQMNERMAQTPNIKASKVEGGERYNKKTDYTALASTKWNTNNLALESKHQKDKDLNTRDRFLNEFGASSIFGEQPAKKYVKSENNHEFMGNIKHDNQWNKVHDNPSSGMGKPKVQVKQSAPVKADAHFLKATKSSSFVSTNSKK